MKYSITKVMLYLVLFSLIELIIIKAYVYAPCYSPFTGRPNFIYVYLLEIHSILLILFTTIMYCYYKYQQYHK